MRFWTLFLLIILVVAALFESADLFEEVKFNPFGHTIDIKLHSDDDPLTREVKVITNDTEPVWGKVNYGKLDSLRSAYTDANGTKGTQVDDAPPMVDMLENSLAESKVAPLPKGLTVQTLPGMQPDGVLLNSFAFSPNGADSVMAPRSYYIKNHTVAAYASDKGKVSDKSKAANKVSANINVLQVPYGEESIITDATGVVTKPSDTQKVAMDIDKTLNELRKLARDRANSGALSKVFFTKSGLTKDFNNINNLINTGRYSETYKKGLITGLGTNDNSSRALPGVNIKTELPHQDVYGQFDYIYNSMKDGKGSTVYSPELVSWAKKNTDSIINVLMVNYLLQSQFQGAAGNYKTPISMGNWKETKLPYYTTLNHKGRLTKEPFYLYATIDPKAATLTAGKNAIPQIPSKYIQPDLAYIYSLYTNIMAQVWIGADGKQNKVSYPSQSQTWEDVVSAMNKKIEKKKVSGKSLPDDANKVSQKLGNFENNNLISGLSSQGLGKTGTKEVYSNTEIVGALRIMMSQGESGSGDKVKLGGRNYTITTIGDTKYTKKGSTNLYNAFTKGSDSYEKWKSLINASSKTPIQPAVFRSYWDSGNANAAAYVMMPVMLGGVIFPEAVQFLIQDMMKEKGGDNNLTNLSYSNHYILAFNFKPDSKSQTSNQTGVKEVMAGSPMGNALDKSKPIVLTGYNGGETFSIAEYFQAQDALLNKMDNPPSSAKTIDGKTKKLGYIKLFKDFFTIPTDKAFVGTAKGEIKYVDGFDFEKYKSNYEANKQKSSVSQISPNYSIFFESRDADNTPEPEED